MRRGIAVASAATAAALVALLAVEVLDDGGGDGATLGSGTTLEQTITEAPSGTTPGSAPPVTTPSAGSPYEVDVGECFGTPAGLPPDGELDEVAIVPCDQPHLYEAYHESELPVGLAEPYPGGEGMQAIAADVCTGEAFREFIGATYAAATSFEVQPLVPTAESWIGGDRAVTCAVTPADGLARAGSSRGAMGAPSAP